ncbi:MAG TPA: MmgE/PrpD family protein [Candidatus Udaeobacter sp.]|nr:MmgE/PrpD family protein [Candidatus Udaeobacter sp.]
MTVREPLSRRLARAVLEPDLALPEAASDKLKICLLDLFACALEARDLPWSRQAAKLASGAAGPANVIGTAIATTIPQAAFANATAGHGLVREDMHAGSVSHLGVVVLPVLLALAQRERVSGRAFIDAAVVGYEVGARIGRALVTPDFARLFRPTGFTGPLAAAAAGSRLLGLSESACASALSLAANTVSGLNEWPRSGGAEMFFHPAFAARNAIAAVELAEAGAEASPDALDGEAGLFAAFRPGRPAPEVALFAGPAPELLAVYNKPVPACNFAQTPCQAALALLGEGAIKPADIRAIRVAASRAAIVYPGCDHAGPFERVLQAKMSIQFCVASALLYGRMEEANYRLLDDPELLRLTRATQLIIDADFTAAFPGAQGSAVEVELDDGRVLKSRLADVVPASPERVRARFRAAAAAALGTDKASAIERFVDRLEEAPSVGELPPLTAL